MKGRVIRIPASIANPGPGFETLGLAVSVYLRVSVRRRIDDGRGYERPRANGEDGIVKAFQLEPFRTKRPPSLEVDVADLGVGRYLGVGRWEVGELRSCVVEAGGGRRQPPSALTSILPP